MKMNETQRILFEAADLIRARGLAKYARVAENGSCCIHGAISIAETGDPDTGATWRSSAAVTAVREAINALGYVNPYNKLPYKTGVAPWNNEKERTRDEVITVLEYAASVHA